MALSALIWGPVSLVPGDEVERAFGTLRVRLRRTADELWLCSTHVGEGHGSTTGALSTGDAPTATTLEGAEDWIRWALPATDAIELRPALPDRSVVVSPEQPFFLPPARRARIFVRVPLFVGLHSTSDDGVETLLDELSSLVLSDTWWGTFTEGELGYWLGTRARRAVTSSIFAPHLAVCPLLLINEAEEALPVDRFAVRVSYMTLFARDEAVWTDEVEVRYQGGLDGSEIRYTGETPVDAGDVELIAPSREEAPRGLHARTFGRLRARVGAI